MKHPIALLVTVCTSLLAGQVVHASDELVAGLRIRVRTAEVVTAPGLLHADKTRTSGQDARNDNETGTVSVKVLDGGRMTFPQPRQTLMGEIVAIDDETLLLKLDGHDVRVTIPLSSIAKADRSVGRTGRRHGMGALMGLGIGAMVGATTGLASGDDNCRPSSGPSYFSLGGCFLTFTAGQKAMMLGVLGGGAGAVVGLAVGAGRTDRWSSITIRETPRMRLSVRPLGHTGVSLRVGF